MLKGAEPRLRSRNLGFGGGSPSRLAIELSEAGRDALGIDDQSLVLESKRLLRVEAVPLPADRFVGGEVWARFEGRPVLAGFVLGEGRVVALGLTPLLSDEARALEDRVLRWLARGRDAAQPVERRVAPDPLVDSWASESESDAAPQRRPLLGIRLPLDVRGRELETALEAQCELVVADLSDGLALTVQGESIREMRARVEGRGARLGLLVPGGQSPDDVAQAARLAGGPLLLSNATRREVRLMRERLAAFGIVVLGDRPAGGLAWLQAAAGAERAASHARESVEAIVARLPARLFAMRSIATLPQRPDRAHEDALVFLRSGGGQALLLDPRFDPEGCANALELLRDPLRAAVTLPLVEEQRVRQVVQNRFFRLDALSGRLRFDAAGASAWQQTVARSFEAVRVHGVRPNAGFLNRFVARVGTVGLLRAKSWQQEFDFELGTYRVAASIPLATLTKEPARLALLLDGRLVAERVLDPLARAITPAPGTRELRVALDFATLRQGTRELTMLLSEGSSLRLMDTVVTRVEPVGDEDISAVAAGRYALLLQRNASAFHEELRRVATERDLPGFVLDVRYGRLQDGLRITRRYAFEGYRLASSSRGSWLLTSDVGPRLRILELQLGRRHRLSFRNESLRVRGAARPFEGFRIAVLLDEALPEHVDLEGLRRSLAGLADRAGQTVVGDTPELNRAQGARDLSEWVEVLPGFAQALRVTRPQRREYRVRIERLDALLPAPGLRFVESPQRVLLDGRDWCYRDGPRVYLPSRLGEVLLRTQREETSLVRPSLLSTTARVSVCEYDAERRRLRIVIDPPLTEPRSSRRPGPYRLRIRSVRPRSIDGGTWRAERRDGGHTLQLIEARPGLIELQY